jgi:hypothetical protein
MQQLRRNGLLVANGSPSQKPRRGGTFGFDAAPTELCFYAARSLQICRPAGAGKGAPSL